MRNMLLVAQREFLVNVRKRSFLFAVIGMPIMMGVIFAVVIFATIAGETSGIDETAAIGFVDDGSIVSESAEIPENFIRYETRDAATTALENDEIEVYFYIPTLYMATGRVSVYANEAVSSSLESEFRSFMLDNLAQQLESDISVDRVRDPVDATYYLENTQRPLTPEGLVGLFIIPVLFITVMVVGLQLSSTFLMSGVVEEKTNHIMEILITSVTPYQLLAGKIIGLSLLGLLQIGVWAIVAGILFVIGNDNPFLSGIVLPVDVLLLSLLYFLLTYFLVASLLAGIGAVVGSEQESRQISTFVILPLFAPFFVFSLLLTNPESPVFTVLTLIPFTAATTVMFKLPFAPIPAWELAASLTILISTTIFIVWASAKIFRWAILLQGNKVGIGTLFKVLRGTPDAGIVPDAKQNKQQEVSA